MNSRTYTGMLLAVLLAGCPPQSAPEPEPAPAPAAQAAPAAPAPAPAVSTEPQPAPAPPPPVPRPVLDGDWHLSGPYGVGQACLTVTGDRVVKWDAGCQWPAIDAALQQMVAEADYQERLCVSDGEMELFQRGLGGSGLEGVRRACRETRDRAVSAAQANAEYYKSPARLVTCGPFVQQDDVVAWSLIFWNGTMVDLIVRQAPDGSLAGLLGVYEVMLSRQ